MAFLREKETLYIRDILTKFVVKNCILTTKEANLIYNRCVDAIKELPLELTRAWK